MHLHQANQKDEYIFECVCVVVLGTKINLEYKIQGNKGFLQVSHYLFYYFAEINFDISYFV